jgi:hypothetical protein
MQMSSVLMNVNVQILHAPHGLHRSYSAEEIDNICLCEVI